MTICLKRLIICFVLKLIWFMYSFCYSCHDKKKKIKTIYFPVFFVCLFISQRFLYSIKYYNNFKMVEQFKFNNLTYLLRVHTIK